MSGEDSTSQYMISSTISRKSSEHVHTIVDLCIQMFMTVTMMHVSYILYTHSPQSWRYSVWLSVYITGGVSQGIYNEHCMYMYMYTHDKYSDT